MWYVFYYQLIQALRVLKTKNKRTAHPLGLKSGGEIIKTAGQRSAHKNEHSIVMWKTVWLDTWAPSFQVDLLAPDWETFACSKEWVSPSSESAIPSPQQQNACSPGILSTQSNHELTLHESFMHWNKVVIMGVYYTIMPEDNSEEMVLHRNLLSCYTSHSPVTNTVNRLKSSATPFFSRLPLVSYKHLEEMAQQVGQWEALNDHLGENCIALQTFIY